MRFLLFGVVIMLFLSSSMMAQDVTFGLKAGVNFSNASQGDIDSEGMTSFHVGGVMQALYSEEIALQPEIIYSEQGFSFSEGTAERALKLTYINVPVMVKYFVRKNVFMEAGPQIGFLNTAKLKTTINGDTAERNIKEGMRANDLSLNLGLGFQLNDTLNFNARYCYGLTNIVNRLSDEKFKNRVIQVSFGYFF